MGNALRCISPDHQDVRKKTSRNSPYMSPFSATSFKERSSAFLSSLSVSKKKGTSTTTSRDRFKLDDDDDDDDEEGGVDPDIAKQALAAALLFKHHQKNGTLPFPRSNSVAYPPAASKKNGYFGRSTSSSRPPQPHPDLFLRPNQLFHQDPKIEDVETKHIVLVHGGGFGAWCWYKTIALLMEVGFKVEAVDLAGSGVHSSDSNTITTLSQYAKPLADILGNLSDGDKVILVGHDLGGACVQYVMELFPTKIAKAVFVAATMLSSGKSALDVFSQQAGNNDLMREAQIFVYANGKHNPPTAIDLDKAFLGELLFNRSSSKDVALASVSMRPIPFAPVLEKISLSDKNYGSIPRFYIKTQEDCSAIPLTLQEFMIESSPPEQVFVLKGSDHAPFFSKPQALHRLLLEISQIPT